MKNYRLILLPGIAVLLFSCSATMSSNENETRRWPRYIENLTKRAGLDPLEKGGDQVDQLRIWLIAAGEEEAVFFYDLLPTSSWLVQPKDLFRKRERFVSESRQASFWRELKESEVWYIPDQTAVEVMHHWTDATWVIVERRLNGDVSRVAYNYPWGSDIKEHKILTDLIETITTELEKNRGT